MTFTLNTSVSLTPQDPQDPQEWNVLLLSMFLDASTPELQETKNLYSTLNQVKKLRLCSMKSLSVPYL